MKTARSAVVVYSSSVVKLSLGVGDALFGVGDLAGCSKYQL